MIDNLNKKLLEFLKASPSAFHVVANVREQLLKMNFTEIINANTKIEAGKMYFITKNMSSLIAFMLPNEVPAGYLIAASHSDSPTYQVKDNAEIGVKDKYIKLNVAPYGGMICSTWLDRPLSVAGKVMISDGDLVRSVLVNIDRDLLLIPNLAIHMNRTANTGYEYKANIDMLPLFGGESAKDTYMDIIAKEVGVDKNAILSTEMYLYNRAQGTLWGSADEFISAPRLDDLQCAFSNFEGFAASKPTDHVIMYMLSDNEEIGSDTKQGAGCEFLFDTLSMINSAYRQSHNEYVYALNNSFMLSCDNAHALHPNHTDVSDASNAPYLNGGVVIKYGVRYATDSVAEAIFKKICIRNSIPFQTYSNRSDMAGGATLGNISNTKVSLNTVDIGIAQLAMHSSYETAGAHDTKHMVDAIKAFYSTTLIHNGNGEYVLT